ncbi:hypothetical protein GCM10028857_23970 [Salinarchaeum chitinilyticum]
MNDAGDPSDSPATLAELRERIRELSTVDGEFVVACARTGESPVPIDGYRFPDRETAAQAATVTIEYRERLRRLDPRTPRYDPVAHELPVEAGSGAVTALAPPAEAPLAGSGYRDWRRPVGTDAGLDE